MYQPLCPARTAFVPLRHHRYHVRSWGEPRAGTPPLVLLHGWMDVGASWQFVVDALAVRGGDGRQTLAPDWRGFGLTEGPPTDHYWFPDYLADLDALLDQLAPGQQVDLAGHSMGGNVAMLYAGARPGRIRRLVNLEGFGLPATEPGQAPARHAEWMDELKQAAGGGLGMATYADAEGVARRLMKNNPRLPLDKALWLAQHWARPVAQADGRVRWQILADPAHKTIGAQLYRADEACAHFSSITAATLVLEADGAPLARWDGRYTLDDWHKRLRKVRDCRIATVAEAGHMLHHDQPARVAQLIGDFLDA
ncbi:MAG: alpha/beta hydrolase [Pseudomonadota bacterium]